MVSKCNAVLFFFLMLFFVSCGKDENDADATAGKITCEIDGTPFTSTQNDVQMHSSFFLIGAKSGTTLISINISDIKVGTYALKSSAGNDATLSILLDGFSTSNVTDANAKLEITEINTKDSTITGTFQFEATSLLTNKKVIVTNGKINKVKFVQIIDFGNTLSCSAEDAGFSAFNLKGTGDASGLSISGSSFGFEQSLYLYMSQNITPGTYNLKDGTDTYAVYKDDLSGFFGYVSKSGKLVIKGHNKTTKTINGTFEFEGESQGVDTIYKKSIKNGKFNINYK